MRGHTPPRNDAAAHNLSPETAPPAETTLRMWPRHIREEPGLIGLEVWFSPARKIMILPRCVRRRRVAPHAAIATNKTP